jgi:hypothetical protein
MQMRQRVRLGVLVAAMGCGAGAAWADGTVQQLSGTISVQKPDGTVKVLQRQSEVVKGDTLNTEKDSYAQVKFADGGIVTLKPNTRIKIDDFVFSEKEPAKDSSTLSLLRGGLRMITGLIGKRGNPDAFRANTVTATIGIRGTTFTVDDCLTTACVKRGATRTGEAGGINYASRDTDTRIDAAGGEFSANPEEFKAWVARDRARTAALKQAAGGLTATLLAQNEARCNPQDECLPPSVIVGVSDGEILVGNGSGPPVSYKAGQWGMVQSFNSRPLTLPGDPGLPIYQPPATFFQNISAGGVRNSSSQCIVN